LYYIMLLCLMKNQMFNSIFEAVDLNQIQIRINDITYSILFSDWTNYDIFGLIDLSYCIRKCQFSFIFMRYFTNYQIFLFNNNHNNDWEKFNYFFL